MNKETDLTGGFLPKQIILFSIPLMLSNVLQVMFNMADVAVAGRFAGELALGAIGSTTMLVALYTGILIGMASGINILTALAIGSGRDREIRNTVHTSAVISLLTGILTAIIGIASARFILSILNTKDVLIDDAVVYLRIYLLGMPALSVYNFGNAVYSAAGNTRKPLMFLAFSGAVNIVLNLLFIVRMGMGVRGAALASIIAQYISAILIVRSLAAQKQVYGIDIRHFSFSREIASKILKLGVPSGIQNAIFYVANLFVQGGVNSFSAVVVAGNSAAANADALVYDMMAAFYVACGSFMGQNFGAGKKKRIIHSYFICMFYAFLTAFVLGASLVIFGRGFLSLFASNEAVIDAGMERLTIMGLSYCVSAFMDTAIAAARSLGKSLVPTLIVIAGSCVFRIIWIYTVFAHFQTTTSLYLLYVFSWTITAAAGNLYFAKVYREKMNDEGTEKSAQIG